MLLWQMTTGDARDEGLGCRDSFSPLILSARRVSGRDDLRDGAPFVKRMET